MSILDQRVDSLCKELEESAAIRDILAWIPGFKGVFERYDGSAVFSHDIYEIAIYPSGEWGIMDEHMYTKSGKGLDSLISALDRIGALG